MRLYVPLGFPIFCKKHLILLQNIKNNWECRKVIEITIFNYEKFLVTTVSGKFETYIACNQVVCTLRISVNFQWICIFYQKFKKVIDITILNYEKFFKKWKNWLFESIAITNLAVHFFKFRIEPFIVVVMLQTTHEAIANILPIVSVARISKII